MRIKEGNKWGTAFKTWYSYFKPQIMSFGLSNALTSFQSFINKILAKKLNILVIVYLNNIIIYTKELGQTYVNVI